MTITAAITTVAPLLRAIEPADRDAAAGILFEAFVGIHDRHAFPRDFPPWRQPSSWSATTSDTP